MTFHDVVRKTGKNQYSVKPVIKFLPSNSKFEMNAKITALDNDTGMSLTVDADILGFKQPIRLVNSIINFYLYC